MSEVVDLERFSSGVYAVGWLGSFVPTTGPTPDECIQRLFDAHADGWGLSDGSLGWHDCEICTTEAEWYPGGKIGPVIRWQGCELRLYGAGHFLVRHEGQVYCCPALTLHYILDHGYRPPDEFVRAVLHGRFVEHRDSLAQQETRGGNDGSLSADGRDAAMTEAEWLTSTDPMPMLEFVRGKVSDRKLWLYAAACCRRIQQEKNEHLFHTTKAQDQLTRAIEATERYADGQVGPQARKAPWLGWMDAEVAASQTDLMSYSFLRGVVWGSAWYAARVGGEANAVGGRGAPLLRDIVGPISFRPLEIDPVWLQSNGGSIPALARRIYEERASHDMPALGDALMDAGCANADILAHCREPGEHVRGCWVLDVLLGKDEPR
jgi:hypothetical protein